MTNETEFRSIKDLYRTVTADEQDPVSYNAFLKKIQRLAAGNKRTTNRLSRDLGVKVDRTPTREFVSYDGEGWGDKYVLLANSDGGRISNPDGLSTVDCLEFLASGFFKPVKRIFFSFNYDVNHIIKDLPDEQIETLLAGKSIIYEGYRVSYIPGKMFVVNGYTYYDIFSFFATSFINVVHRMLGKEYVSKTLVEGKENRGVFETWDLDKLIAYNDEELNLMVMIANKLRLAFEEIGVNLTQWYGPGAVAKYWFAEHGVTPKEKHTKGSITALNSAYFGGRFEQITLGKIKDVYEYDIHSAYPSAMVDMPYFDSWEKVPKGQFRANPYSVWHITFDLRECRRKKQPIYKTQPQLINFMPLPVRSKDGRICFPLMGKGWYWYDEVQVMLDFFPEAKVTYHEGYVANTHATPFAWIRELYDYRRSLKDTGNLAQYAIKVGLNSLYGKCAQRVGRNPYFSLAWAGYITSHTRAKLARAAYESGADHILGFATDALFSDSKLQLQSSDDLGSWEESHYASATFFQSGIYRLVREDGTFDDRYRGSPLRRGIDDISDQLKRYPTKYPKVRIVRFISHMLAIKAPLAYARYRTKFVQVVHETKLDATYKRHYNFQGQYTSPTGTYVANYGKLLREPITSFPKVFSGDDFTLASNMFLWDDMKPAYIESCAPAMKDGNTQRLLEEAEMLGIEEGYDDVSMLDALPMVEDEMS